MALKNGRSVVVRPIRVELSGSGRASGGPLNGVGRGGSRESNTRGGCTRVVSNTPHKAGGGRKFKQGGGGSRGRGRGVVDRKS